MPRGQLTKDEMKVNVLKLKKKLQHEAIDSSAKDLTNYYLNLILDKLEEYVR